jgi:hypothetical protein
MMHGMGRALAILWLPVKIALLDAVAIVACLLLAMAWFDLPSRATPDERELLDRVVELVRREGTRMPSLCIDKLTERGGQGGNSYAQNWSSERYSGDQLQELYQASSAKDVRLIVDQTALPHLWIDSFWNGKCEHRIGIGRPMFNRNFAFVETRNDLRLPTSHGLLRQTSLTVYAWKKSGRDWEPIATNVEWVGPII